MDSFFRVKLLPAKHGDCIWIEYGKPNAVNRILIDGGPVSAQGALVAEIEKLPLDERTFELLVVTHIDADHIDGVVKLMRHPELGVKFKEVWFNGWPQIKDLPSPAALLEEQALNTRAPISGSYLDYLTVRKGDGCNARFRNRAVCVPDEGVLPRVTLEGGMDLTLLSPGIEGLRALRQTWYQAFQKMGADPGNEAIVEAKLAKDTRFRGDETAVAAVPAGIDEAAALATDLDCAVANGSSIAFVAEYADQRCAFLGDAHAPIIEKSLRRMASAHSEEPLRLSAVKLSHHGSKGNTTSGLLKAIDCRNFLVSTNGDIFHHPDDDAINRVIKFSGPVHLYFNYLSERTKGWRTETPEAGRSYVSRYPTREGDALEIDLVKASAEP